MNTPLEDQVHDALHRQADPLDRSPLTVTDVQRGARRIRRRRRITAGAAVVAVLAVAVPLGLGMKGPAQRTDAPTVTQPPSPSEVGTVRIDPRSAPVGDELGVPLLDVDRPSITVLGRTTALSKPYDSLTPYMDGWVGVVDEEGALSLEFLDQDFRVTDGSRSTGGLVVSPDGGHVAWTEYDGDRWRVVSGDAAGADAQTYTPFAPSPEQRTVRPIGFVSGTEVLVSQTDAAGDVTTFVADGGTPAEVPGLLKPLSASPVAGLAAGTTRVVKGSACSAVVDARNRTGAVAWQTCDHLLGAFSPDGRYIVGFAPDADAYGSPTLSVLDASTGEPVVAFEVAGARNQVVGISDLVAWEDADTVAITMISGSQQYVVRLGADGTVERMGGDSPTAQPDTVPFRFAETR